MRTITWAAGALAAALTIAVGPAFAQNAQSGNGELVLGADPTVAGGGPQVGVLAGRPTVSIVRASEPPEIDGRIDDVVWRTAARVTQFVQQRPLEGAPATEQTEIYLAYDSQNLYFAIHAHYSDPGLIRANRVDRDQTGRDDTVRLYFDPFLDQQRAYVFSVNGYGVQGDAIMNSGDAFGAFGSLAPGAGSRIPDQRRLLGTADAEDPAAESHERWRPLRPSRRRLVERPLRVVRTHGGGRVDGGDGDSIQEPAVSRPAAG